MEQACPGIVGPRAYALGYDLFAAARLNRFIQTQLQRGDRVIDIL